MGSGQGSLKIVRICGPQGSPCFRCVVCAVRASGAIDSRRWPRLAVGEVMGGRREGTIVGFAAIICASFAGAIGEMCRCLSVWRDRCLGEPARGKR